MDAPKKEASSKRPAAILFTATDTYVGWLRQPPIPCETARVEISRGMAARMLRKKRNDLRGLNAND